ncbi:hypothetical protein FPRO06_00288 [Fusarium proliferatum]|nr:hypothetical protein FPRO06_00288 [Fusarium proliferatum]
MNDKRDIKLYSVLQRDCHSPVFSSDEKASGYSSAIFSYNDRSRVVKNELNNPGAIRGVVTGNHTTGENFGLVGVTYHPEDRPRALRREPIEPLDREGRQFLRRFDDDAADPHPVTTWPPRDEDASELQAYEERYKQVRRPRPPQQQKAKQRAPNTN